MSFRLVPKLVTLNDLERRNGVIFCYFTEFGCFLGQLAINRFSPDKCHKVRQVTNQARRTRCALRCSGASSYLYIL